VAEQAARNDTINASRDPVAQARAHFAASGGLGESAGELPPALDLEWPEPQDWAKWGVTADTIKAHALAYLAECERLHGVSPLIYTYPVYARALGLGAEFLRYRLWEASYSSRPMGIPPWPGCHIWQDAGGSKGRLYSGRPVDTDEIADEATLQELISR
jgi:lysozyme